jgi:uncharacterized membrane protein
MRQKKRGGLFFLRLGSKRARARARPGCSMGITEEIEGRRAFFLITIFFPLNRRACTYHPHGPWLACALCCLFACHLRCSYSRSEKRRSARGRRMGVIEQTVLAGLLQMDV